MKSIGCFIELSRMFQASFMNRKFQGSFKGVYRKFQRCFKEVFLCNFVVAWISLQLPKQKETLFPKLVKFSRCEGGLIGGVGWYGKVILMSNLQGV